ncbi:MAG: glycoside hydrolase family 57 protein [Thermoprotei archaeon]
MVKHFLLCFEAHQPHRLGRVRFWDKEISFWEHYNKEVLSRVSSKCYLKANNMLLEEGALRGGFSMSGSLLEQLEEAGRNDVLEGFSKLFDSGRFEPIGETYYHSLSSLVDSSEFLEQVGMHRSAIRRLFGAIPKVFVNTELIFNRKIAQRVRAAGFDTIFAEGAPTLLRGRNTNNVYTVGGVKLIIRNNALSDDIGFRFSDKSWSEYPLTADKYATWVERSPGDIATVYIDYETFGEHHQAESGVFEFARHLGRELASRGVRMLTPSEAADISDCAGELEAEEYTSWADVEKDLSAWLSNEMQREAFEAIYKLEKPVKNNGDPLLLREWRFLTESDHLYYCSTKAQSAEVHLYFNPYKNPYTAFINLSNAIHIITKKVGCDDVGFD